jgi:Bacterial protein of unknown function (DUF839)
VTRSSRRTGFLVPLAAAVILVAPGTSLATHTPAPVPPLCTNTSFLSLETFGTLQSIICSGQFVTTTHGTFEFQGIPDGIGIMPGPTTGTVDVFVNHEESHVPFPAPPAADAAADFQDSSVSKLTIDTTTGLIVDADVSLSADAGFLRFCSAFMAGPDEGFSKYTFFTNEETDDVVPVPAGAPYGPDPSVAPNRQGGYSVVLDPASGEFTHVAGMGRHNHENTVPIPGGWKKFAILSTDDTFTAATSQLYLYLANKEDDIWKDRGSLWAFQVTRTEGGPVDPFDPFNEANDYLDLTAGEKFQGRFIRVPKEIAKGTTGVRPQLALENWSNENNVFQFVRLEDIDYDRTNNRIAYIADTGATRVVPDPATGRMRRPPGAGQADNGSIFRFKFDKKNPRKVVSFSLLVDADPGGSSPGVMHQPDNLGINEASLMIQEDSGPPNPNSRIWRYDLGTGSLSVVAHVNESDWESSGIVDASEWFGPGAWLLDVQGHGSDDWVDHEVPAAGRPWFLRQEAGQLLLMRLPGT